MKMRIKILRKSLKNWTQADLAEATNLSQSYIGAIESENIKKSPSMDTLSSIAKALGVRIGDLFNDARPVAIVGKVGAGARVPLIDAFEKGDGFYYVERPSDIPPGESIVGVEIQGDSMLPVYKHGDVLFYSRTAIGVPSEAVGSICVCQDSDGNAWVKYVKTGSTPDRFHLISLNPLVGNMFDVALEWASPVRLHWPSDLVHHLERDDLDAEPPFFDA